MIGWKLAARAAAWAFVLLVLALPSTAWADRADRQAGGVDRFIVMFKPGTAMRNDHGRRRQLLADVSRPDGASLRSSLRLGIGADVFTLDRKLSPGRAQSLMNRLRRHPDVQYVEPDRRVEATLVPQDRYYYLQWNLFETKGGIDMPAAWDLATGESIRVAVVDTGSTIHSEFVNTLGYDFISDPATAADGNGRDSDPSDAGDWAAAGVCGPGSPATDSSWHGTQVSGIIGSFLNSTGIAGVAPTAQSVPLRVLGRCGGQMSDVIDAIHWAAGGTVPGAPTGMPPVKVVNLSLSGAGTCGPSLQAVIDEAVAAGAVVVTSAGNDGDDAGQYFPGNCKNVVNVGASSRLGAREDYSNYGAAVDLMAPGGGNNGFIPTTFNTGTTVQGTETYVYTAGTSIAAPHVAGVAAMMKRVGNPSPAAIEAILKSTARPLPVVCPEGCGAGVLSAAPAVGEAKAGSLWVEDAIAFENNGQGGLAFTVHLTRALPNPVSFDLTASAGTADAMDFPALSWVGQVMPAGQTSRTFVVPVLGDDIFEADETVFLTASNVVGAAVADAKATGLIRNDDPKMLADQLWTKIGQLVPPTISLYQINAGEEVLFAIDVPAGVGELKVETRSAVTVDTDDIDVLVKRDGRPSFASADCIAATASGAESCSIPSPAPGRYFIVVYGFEVAEDHVVRATFTPAAALPSLMIRDAVAVEGQDLMFWYELSAPPTVDATFYYVLRPGSAKPGSDYPGPEFGMATIAAPAADDLTIHAGGGTGSYFNIPTVQDNIVEGNEVFYLDIYGLSGISSAPSPVKLRIQNDDLAELTVADASVTEGSDGATTMIFTLTLSAPMPTPVWVTLQTVAGSASGGSDFVARPQELRFIDAGRTRLQYEVQVTGDGVHEANEQFTVQVTKLVGATLKDGTATGTIVDDDPAAAPLKPAARRGVVLPAPGEPDASLACVPGSSAAPAVPATPASRSSARPAPPARSTRCPAVPASPRPARSRPGGRS